MLRETKELLASSDPEDRRRGVESLANLRSEEAVSVLPVALGDSDWRVRKQAIGVAARREPDKALVEAIARLLGPSENVGLRNAAVEVLANWGGRAIDALAEEAKKLDEDGRKLVAEALGKTGHAAALPLLRAMLEDEDTNVRLTALEGIASLGVVCPDEAADALRGRLMLGDVMEKLTALDGINQLGIVVQFDQIESLLQDRVLRQAAWLAAGRCREARVAARLVAALDGSEGSAWRWALAAVASCVGGSERLCQEARPALLSLSAETVDRLFSAARSSEFFDERRRAIVVLGALGTPEAVRVVFSAMRDDQVADVAEQAFEMFGPEACDPLLEMYRSLGAEDRATALRLCGRLASDGLSSGALSVVLEALRGDDVDVAVGALECVASASDEACVEPTALWLEQTRDVVVRKFASAALDAMVGRHFDAARTVARKACPDGTGALSAVTIIGAALTPVLDSREQDVHFLADAVSHSDPSVRRAALSALAKAADARAVDAVSFALADEVAEVRVGATRALGRLRTDAGEPAGLKPLLEVVRTSTDEMVLVSAIRALGDTGAAEALSCLQPLISSAAPLVAIAALEAVSELDAQSRASALVGGLSHSHVEVVKGALKALRGCISDEVIARICVCLGHSAWDVRRASADWLGRFGGPAALSFLRSRLAIEAEPLVREALQRSLSGGEVVRMVRRHTPVPGIGSWPPR